MEPPAKLAQPKSRDTEEGPMPAAPPRTEGVAGCPYAPLRREGEGAKRLRGCFFSRHDIAGIGPQRLSHIQIATGIGGQQHRRGRHFVGAAEAAQRQAGLLGALDRKSTRLNSSHLVISYAVFCLKKTT